MLHADVGKTGGTAVVMRAESGGFISACFGENAAPMLVIVPLDSAELCITHLDFCVGPAGRKVVLPAHDGFLVLLYLTDTCHSDLWPDRPASVRRDYRAGSICLVSLRQGASIQIHQDFRALAFHLSSHVLEELRYEAGELPVVDLLTCRGVNDAVVWNLSTALLPMLDGAVQVNQTLLQHIGLALNAHITHRYGCLPRGDGVVLSQALREKRAQDFMIANFERELDLVEIAAASGLEIDDLTDDFADTGIGALHWLMRYRVDRSKSYLQDGGLTLSEVAQRCGFASETAFEASFAAAVGAPPTAWRIRGRH